MQSAASAVQFLGPIRVTADPDTVAAYRRVAGWPHAEGQPPASFPVVVMNLPEVGDAIRAAAQEVGLPVHEAQHFEYSRPIRLGEYYDLMLELRRESDPARLVVSAEVSDSSGARIGRIVSTLRLIDPATIPGAPEP
jgi:hypothetical protein